MTSMTAEISLHLSFLFALADRGSSHHTLSLAACFRMIAIPASLGAPRESRTWTRLRAAREQERQGAWALINCLMGEIKQKSEREIILGREGLVGLTGTSARGPAPSCSSRASSCTCLSNRRARGEGGRSAATGCCVRAECREFHSSCDYSRVGLSLSLCPGLTPRPVVAEDFRLATLHPKLHRRALRGRGKR